MQIYRLSSRARQCEERVEPLGQRLELEVCRVRESGDAGGLDASRQPRTQHLEVESESIERILELVCGALGQALERYVPPRFDGAAYSPASASSGAACTATGAPGARCIVGAFTKRATVSAVFETRNCSNKKPKVLS